MSSFFRVIAEAWETLLRRLSGIDMGDTSSMDIFGSTAPNLMPEHFFISDTTVSLDYDHVLRADIERQNYSVAPRNWYIASTIKCRTCGEDFLFSVDEQKRWYEEFRFYVDSFPNRCRDCRAELREIKQLRQEYDAAIQEALQTSCGDIALKRKLVTNIERLIDSDGGAADKMLERRDILVAQIRRLEPPTSANDGGSSE
jgi:hypothetical protein